MVRHKGPARGPTMVDRTCEFCDKTFQATAYEVKIGKGRFCSKSCSNKSRYERITLVCEHCGTEFQRMLAVYLRRKSDTVYCSGYCYRAARLGGDTRVCKACGQEKPLDAFRTFQRKDKTYHQRTCSDCANQKQRAQRINDPGRHREYDRRSYEKHREVVIQRKIVLNGKRRAWMHGITDVSDVRLDDLIERYGTACYLCGKELERSQMTRDHVVPLTRGGSHTLENVRIACMSCDARKGNYLLSELDLDTLKPTIKDCSHCGQIKPISQFSTMGRTWQKYCRACSASLARQERSLHRNITVVDTLSEVYRCNVCAFEWQPIQEDALQNIRWYWRCPNGCNHNGVKLNTEERSCTHCGEVMPLKQFRNDKRKATGYRCKRCTAALARQSRAERFGVTVVDSVQDICRCKTCAAEWTPKLAPGKQQMRNWWLCPNGCNSNLLRYPPK